MKNKQILTIIFILAFISSILLGFMISEYRISHIEKSTITNEKINELYNLVSDMPNDMNGANITLEIDGRIITGIYNQTYSDYKNVNKAKNLIQEINQSVAFLNGVCLK